MKFTKYLKDIWVVVLIFIIFFITMLSFFIAFKITKELILAFIITYIIFSTTILLYSYYRKKYFYQTFLNNLNKLDQKYLITELMKKPNFYEGKIIYDAIYEIDK